jgi:hypothetical protein
VWDSIPFVMALTPRSQRRAKISIPKFYVAANEYLGLIERAENGGHRAYANWTAPSSGQ